MAQAFYGEWREDWVYHVSPRTLPLLFLVTWVIFALSEKSLQPRDDTFLLTQPHPFQTNPRNFCSNGIKCLSTEAANILATDSNCSFSSI